jgi:hypothetical protein
LGGTPSGQWRDSNLINKLAAADSHEKMLADIIFDGPRDSQPPLDVTPGITAIRVPYSVGVI